MSKVAVPRRPLFTITHRTEEVGGECLELDQPEKHGLVREREVPGQPFMLWSDGLLRYRGVYYGNPEVWPCVVEDWAEGCTRIDVIKREGAPRSTNWF